jgi:agmatine deiminase
MLQGATNVQVHRITTDDCWIRDYGPTWVLEDQGRRVAGVDWHFNAWGSKYELFWNDRVAARRILHSCRHRRIASPLTCEGGGLETDGQGTLLATSSSLLTASRNPGWTRQQIERELSLRLGIEKVLWIDGGSLAGDDTDSHIDQLVRFVAPGRVVAAVASRVEDTGTGTSVAVDPGVGRCAGPPSGMHRPANPASTIHPGNSGTRKLLQLLYRQRVGGCTAIWIPGCR